MKVPSEMTPPLTPALLNLSHFVENVCIKPQGQLHFQVDDPNIFKEVDPDTYLFNNSGVSSSSRMRNLLFCLFSLISRRAMCNVAGETGRARPINGKVWQNEKIYFFESFHSDQGFFGLDAVL